MASNVKPKVYTGATAALSVLDGSGNVKRVAYVSDFTIDMSSNSEDFNVLGQLYQESIPTYNNWTANSSAKASFENDGQKLLITAYNTLTPIKCEFVLNSGVATGGVDPDLIKFSGWAIVESLSIGVGDSVSSFDISLKGTGDLDVDLPANSPVTAISIPSSISIGVNDAKTLDVQLTGTGGRAPSNTDVEWSLVEDGSTISDGNGSYVKLNQRGQVVAKAATGTKVVTVTATAKGGTSITDSCTVTVS